MLKSNRILALDIGASSIKVGEFTLDRAGKLRLTGFHVGDLGIDPDSEADHERLVVTTLNQLVRERKIKPGPAVVAASGQAVFTRFVKLPPVEPDKISQIVLYEAQQNVPFPIEEVVWDYQLLGDVTSDELEVLLVAIKGELSEELVGQAEECRFPVDTVDVAPVALYNAVRYSAGPLAESTLILDIGARSTNLVFVEGDSFYARTVPIAGNAITRQVAREFDLPFVEAEELKRTEGRAPVEGDAGEGEVGERVAKAVRMALQRLVAEITRTTNFYRTQQQGGPPTRILLTGGSSMLTNLDVFLAGKLRLPVEYLNPFVGIEIDEAVDFAELSGAGHLCAGLVGLGLRETPACPIRVNLLPKSVSARQTFIRREPYLIAAAAGLVLLLSAWWAYAAKVASIYDQKVGPLRSEVEKWQDLERELGDAQGRFDEVDEQIAEVTDVLADRTRWMEIIDTVNRALPADVWVVRMSPSTVPLPKPGEEPVSEDGEGSPGGGQPPGWGMMPGMGGMPGGGPGMPGMPGGMGMMGPPGGMMMMGPGGEGEVQITRDIASLQIEGMVYRNPQVEHQELDLTFRNRLRESELFIDDQTEIIEAPLANPGDITRPFRIIATLTEPIVQ